MGIKDSVCVAGVPMMNGSIIMEGYVPDVDATVVTRILDAGGSLTVQKCFIAKNICANSYIPRARTHAFVIQITKKSD